MTRSSKNAGVQQTSAETTAVNEVRLVGRVSGTAQERSLPSGDTVLQLRVVVARDPASVRRSSGQTHPVTVDTIDVACWRRPLQRTMSRLTDGSVIEVRGSLRRRFWRSASGAASKYEVEASAVMLLCAAPDPRREAGAVRRTMRG